MIELSERQFKQQKTLAHSFFSRIFEKKREKDRKI